MIEPVIELRPAARFDALPSPSPTLGFDASVAPAPGLHVDLARDAREVLEAQRLRYQIFAEEKGAQLAPVTVDGCVLSDVDVDRFDRFCDHLVVRDGRGRLVGTTRVLTQEQALKAGGFYSETEFDLTAVLRRPGRFLEVGRTCIHPDHRNGATIAVLWSGVASLLQDYGYDHLIGCASICLSSGLGPVRTLVARILDQHLSPEDMRAIPFQPLPASLLGEGPLTACNLPAPAPPLLKAYLRLGAVICGDAAWDPDFQCADLLVLVERRNLNLRYARHFLKAC